MKTILNFKLLFIALGLGVCFLFLNFKCTEIVNTTSPTTPPSSENRSKAKVLYIELLNFWAAEQTYTDCVRNSQKCEKEKQAMLSLEKLARGIVIPPLPRPPSPCSPWGNCDDLKFLEHLVYPATEKYKITVLDKKSNKTIAYNLPGTAYKSNLAPGYVNTKYKVIAPNYSGFATVEISNIGTNETHSYDVKM